MRLHFPVFADFIPDFGDPTVFADFIPDLGGCGSRVDLTSRTCLAFQNSA